VPASQALAPLRRHLLRVFVRFQPGVARIVEIDPGREVRRAQRGEGQQQVGDVALGVNDDGRDVVQHRLFEQGDAQAGLAAAGHAQHDGVRGQVARIIVDDLVGWLVRRRIESPAQVKGGGSFDKRHGAPRWWVVIGGWWLVQAGRSRAAPDPNPPARMP